MRQPVLGIGTVVDTGKDSPARLAWWQGMEGHGQRPFVYQEEKTGCLGRAQESFSLAEHGQAVVSHGAEGWEVHVVVKQDWDKGSCGTPVSSRAGLGALHPQHHPPSPTPLRAVCSDVGAHFRQPELGRWFPRKEAGSWLHSGGW